MCFVTPVRGLKKLLQRRNDDIIGASVFPTPTAGNGKVTVDKYTGQIDNWACQQCGAQNRVANGAQSPGTYAQGDGFITNDASTGDPTVKRPGCWNCGTANSRRG